MNEFHVIDQLALRCGELQCRNKRKYYKAHFRQGELDGACGAYSISIALNLLGVYDAERELTNTKKCTKDGRKVELKLTNKLNSRGLYKEGLDYDQVIEMLDDYKKYISIDSALSLKDDDEKIEFVKNHIDKNHPIILGVGYSGGGHWLVVVGYETNLNGNVVHLLTLDPGYDSPKFAMWNGILELEKNPNKKYSYLYQTMNNCMVSIEEFIAVEKK